MCSNFIFSPKTVPFVSVEYCDIAGQATDGYRLRRMRFACWIPKATDTHSEYVVLTAFLYCING